MIFTKQQPKTVDSVLNTFNQALADLEEVKNGHEQGASKVSAEVERLLTLKEQHLNEYERSHRVIENIRKLIGA